MSLGYLAARAQKEGREEGKKEGRKEERKEGRARWEEKMECSPSFLGRGYVDVNVDVDVDEYGGMRKMRRDMENDDDTICPYICTFFEISLITGAANESTIHNPHTNIYTLALSSANQVK